MLKKISCPSQTIGNSNHNVLMLSELALVDMYVVT